MATAAPFISSGPRIIEPFEFEKFDVIKSQEWVKSYQSTVLYASVVYIVLAIVGREWMKDRKPYKLRNALIIWNWILAIFSTVGFLRTAPAFLSLLVEPNGIYRSVCTRDNGFEPDQFWAFLFVVSKLFEFVDTIFVVLRKAPLLFVHYYHHATMAIFAFYLYPIYDPVNRWNGTINYGIHSIMYGYYALKVGGFYIPKSVSSVITKLQMIQFALTLFANIYAVVMLGLGQPCILSSLTMRMQFLGGVTYLALFANYYYQTYVKRKPKTV